MKLSDFLCKKAIAVDLKGTTKKDVVQELIGLLVEGEVVDKKDKNKIFDVIMAREELGSTAIGQGVAIPHAKFEGVDKLIASLGISKNGVDFDSLDGEPAHVFFLLVAPMDSAGPHLKALARISRLLKDKFFRDSLRAAENTKAVLKLIALEDERIG
ncbi:MAG TPA: PTS sugar transporter subunit IIA [Candidatus Omnitrophota bacterium]|nr:PTS sugar transporter subunit IIA [Candidatus Omnitrophota bacterium]